MLTLYHAPHSRSSRIVRLLDELGALDRVRIEIVTIPRQDGSGGPDPENPHPDGKVPMLVEGQTRVWESNAIMTYLCERFPGAGLAPMPGEPGRGAFLSWMAYYGNVLEPLMILRAMEVEHPLVERTYRGIGAAVARLAEALNARPYLLGEAFSAADLLMVSAFTWAPGMVPDVPAIRDWVARCEARPSAARLVAFEERALAAMA